MALANYVPHVSQEVAQIVRLGAQRLVSWPINSSTSEEEEEKQEEEEEQEQEEEQEEVGPKPLIMDMELEQGEEDQEGELEPSRQWCSRDWEVVMGEEERLAFDDPWSDSDATADGCSLRCPTPHEPGSPMEVAVEVHARESEVEDL